MLLETKKKYSQLSAFAVILLSHCTHS